MFKSAIFSVVDDLPAQNDEADSTPRVMADEHGTILYANKAFEELCGVVKDGHRLSLIDLLQFNDPDNAFRGPMISGEAALAGLQSGYHDVFFDESRQSAGLQFDWIDSPDGRRILVASATPGEINTESFTSLLPQTDKNTDHEDADIFMSMMRDIMIVWDMDGKFQSGNYRFSRADNFMAMVHEGDRVMVRPLWQQLMLGEDTAYPVKFDCRMVDGEGVTRHIDWTHSTQRGKIYSLGRDITPMKQQQFTLDYRERQLQEAETIGHFGHWHWSTGEDDIHLSDNLYKIFGIDKDSFHPTLDNINALVNRRDIGRLMQALQRAMMEQKDYDLDFRIAKPDGEIAYIQCQGRCRLDMDGEVIALYGIMQDVTQRIRHEQDLKKAKNAAEAAYATKSQFLANMSHELRTPLNAIIGFSEMMEQQLLGPLGNEKYVDYIKGIRESGEHLLDLISDILDMSKIEAGKYELALEQVTIAKSIRLAAHMMESRALEKNIRINLEIANEGRIIIADRRAVAQIMLNLLSNAVKFSHENGAIIVQCVEREDYLSIRVTDKGVGIPAHKIPLITKPFEQVANQYTRDHDGSGLGLAITKELVELHGGNMHIDSVIGDGTTVTIRLPYKQ